MSDFELAHASDIALAAAYQRRGRANAAEREECCDMQMRIWARLIELAPEGDGNDST
jgi:hypothetical protein